MPSSIYRGIVYDSTRKQWIAQIFVKGKRKYLGRYSDETEAARAYDVAAKEFLGEQALLNFPTGFDPDQTPLQMLFRPLPLSNAGKSGYIYFIQDTNGLTKIGRSTIPKQRASQLKQSHFLCAVHVNNSVYYEQYLHYMFKQQHSHGEWFNLSIGDINRAIATLLELTIPMESGAERMPQ